MADSEKERAGLRRQFHLQVVETRTEDGNISGPRPKVAGDEYRTVDPVIAGSSPVALPLKERPETQKIRSCRTSIATISEDFTGPHCGLLLDS